MYSALGEKTAAGTRENFQAMAGLEDDSIWADLKLFAEQIHHGQGNGGHQVCATADRFRQDDIGSLTLFQLAHGIGQAIEVATKTGAGHFFHVVTVTLEQLRIDEIGGLIVGDDADMFALSLITLGQLSQDGRFAGAQKAAEHDESYALRHETSRVMSVHKTSSTVAVLRLVNQRSPIRRTESVPGCASS